MPAMEYLRFYLDRNCVVLPGYGTTKNTRKGCGSWTVGDTKRNTKWLRNNAKVRNGTGGLLIVDVDPKNGGSVEALRQRFPNLPDTRAVHTVTPHPGGPGVHLIFTIPDDVAVATNHALGTGIDVPDAVMLPGSHVQCEDGIVRMYTLVDDIEPAPAPLALIAAVDKGQESGQAAPVDTGDADGTVAMLVGRFAAAGPGERNAVLTEVALPVLRIAGEEGADMLRAAYPGDDDRWIEQALASARKKAGMSQTPTSRLRSRYVDDVLRWVTEDVRYGRWSNASDRKVMFALVSMCSSLGRMTTSTVSLRDLALMSGVETKTVSSAVARLIESGRLHVVRTTGEGPREYTPKVGEMTTVLSKGDSPRRGVLVDPLHEVWSSDGLRGRASHVFDLVDVGYCKASQVAAAGGMGPDAARDALGALVDVGLLDKQGTTYSMPAGVVETAHTVAMERGGLERALRLADRITEERARPRGDAVPEVADENNNNRRRREMDEQLSRQLGII